MENWHFSNYLQNSRPERVYGTKISYKLTLNETLTAARKVDYLEMLFYADLLKLTRETSQINFTMQQVSLYNLNFSLLLHQPMQFERSIQRLDRFYELENKVEVNKVLKQENNKTDLPRGSFEDIFQFFRYCFVVVK